MDTVFSNVDAVCKENSIPTLTLDIDIHPHTSVSEFGRRPFDFRFRTFRCVDSFDVLLPDFLGAVVEFHCDVSGIHIAYVLDQGR